MKAFNLLVSVLVCSVHSSANAGPKGVEMVRQAFEEKASKVTIPEHLRADFSTCSEASIQSARFWNDERMYPSWVPEKAEETIRICRDAAERDFKIREAMAAEAAARKKADGERAAQEAASPRVVFQKRLSEEWIKNSSLVATARAVQYCRASISLQFAKAEVEKQKRIARVGGVLDKGAMHDAATSVVELTELMGAKAKLLAGGIQKLKRMCNDDEFMVKAALKCGPESGEDYSWPFDDPACESESIHAILMLAEIENL